MLTGCGGRLGFLESPQRGSLAEVDSAKGDGSREQVGIPVRGVSFRWLTVDSEPSYNIVNFLNDRVLDIHGTYPQPGAWVTIQPFSPDSSYNRWEFMIPILGFPPGWFNMQNVRTGHLLSHDYGHNPPVLRPPPNSPVESQHRRNWQFQWTLCHSKCFKFSTASERNSWYIINRLTRAPLSPHFTMEEKDFAGREDNLAWKLELDSACNWKITNRNTSCLLQQTDTIGSAAGKVGCTDGTFTQAGGRQSWILRLFGPGSDIPSGTSTNTQHRPPLLHSGHGAVSLPSINLPHQRPTQPRSLRQHLHRPGLDARTFRGRLAPLILSCRDSSVRTVQSSHLLKTTMRLLRFRLRR